MAVRHVHFIIRIKKSHYQHRTREKHETKSGQKSHITLRKCRHYADYTLGIYELQ